MSDDSRLKAQQAVDNGGILMEEAGDMTRVILAIDPENPEAIFDRINEIEVQLVEHARNDMEAVKNAGAWADSLRENVREQLRTLGIEVSR